MAVIRDLCDLLRWGSMPQSDHKEFTILEGPDISKFCIYSSELMGIIMNMEICFVPGYNYMYNGIGFYYIEDRLLFVDTGYDIKSAMDDLAEKYIYSVHAEKVLVDKIKEAGTFLDKFATDYVRYRDQDK